MQAFLGELWTVESNSTKMVITNYHGYYDSFYYSKKNNDIRKKQNQQVLKGSFN